MSSFHKNFALNVVGKIMLTSFYDTLAEILSKGTQNDFKLWGGNCCRQSAIISAEILSQTLPYFKWTTWEAEFNDVINGKEYTYEHAWTYGTYGDTMILVDLSRVHQERLFISVDANKYPKDHPFYKDMKEVSRKQLHWRKMIYDEEYFTGVPAMFIAESVATAIFR